MCWYQIKYGSEKFQFRAEHFVSKEDGELLNSFHMDFKLTSKQLLEKCIPVLNKYANEIMKQYAEFSKLSQAEKLTPTLINKFIQL